MEVLNKTIKKLTEKEYQDLLSAVAGRKNNKPYVVLETARKQNFNEAQMMELLGVNPSTYYTLKSRLNEKIAEYFSKNIQNPISSLKEKVALVPAMMFGNNREVALRALKNLEKQLIEYDLSNELIVVYKAMARLSMYNGDFDFYEKEYNRHVAYSLAVVKAEDLFYEFVKRAGMYLLTRDARDLEAIQSVMRELTNISELYVGHRLFVYYNIVRLYNLCIITTRPENLKAIELEVESILNQINKHFETYELDTFYQSIRFLVDFLNFEYYTKTGNLVRAEPYYQRINKNLQDIAIKPVFSFYVAQFLNSKIDRFVQNGNVEELTDMNETLERCVDFDQNDPYPYISFRRFLAIGKFYQGDFAASARIVNSLRNDLSLKKYLFTDIECKLFQALQYCIQGDDALCGQILQSVKRQVNDDDDIYESARIFIKMLKTATKPEEFRRKLKKLTEMWEAFQAANTGHRRILSFIKLDESMIRKMGNPIKS